MWSSLRLMVSKQAESAFAAPSIIEDDHGLLCRDRRVFGSIERLCCGWRRQDGPGGKGFKRSWFKALPFALARIGLEAGPLSQRLYAGLKEAGFSVELLETRHVRDAFRAMLVKTDRKDARGIAQLMRLGWFRPVHCKSAPAQETRALLTAQARAGQAPRCGDEPQGRIAGLRP